MKTLSIITVLFLAINFCSAQTANVVAVNNSSNSSSVTKAAHNDMAIEQISSHILSTIQCPNSIKAYGFEGDAVLEVKLTESGTIKTINIQKTSTSKSLDKAILKTMNDFKMIDTQNRQYKGARTILIPLKFDIKA